MQVNYENGILNYYLPLPYQTPKNLNMSEQKQLGRPKGSTGEDTLAKIMPAARQLFADKGYAQTTFKDVGKAVGVSHAAIYSYFPSKKELYLASIAQTQEVLIPYFIDAFTKGKNLKERIRYALMAVAREHDKDSSITAFLVAVPIEIRRHQELSDALTEGGNPIMQALEELFEQAKLSGEIVMDVPVDNLIGAILGGGIGVSLLQYGLHKPDLTSTMEIFVSMIEGRLFASST
ncbi:MAG: AcrR family transcriptional regulator [Chitinophagales bacterium]|jgi:AcrR family transcriptional regulator